MYFPVLNMDEILFNISKSKIHSSMDLRHGFLQIALMLHARPYCAFSCHLGHFQFKRLPFGLVNADYTMNKMMQLSIPQATKMSINVLYC